MTKNEIQRLISSKIKGFGHMIDDVSLAKILNGIINLIPGDLPVASADTLGGVKVGDGLSVTEDGNLSVAGAKLLIAHFAYNSSEDKIVLSLDADGERVYEQEASSTDGGFIPLYTAAEHGAPVTMAVAAKWVLTHPFITFDKEGNSIPITLVPVSNSVTFYMPDGDDIKNMGGQFSFYTSDDVYFYANLDIRQNNFGLYVYRDS